MIDPHKTYEAILPTIIAQNPSTIYRERDTPEDTFTTSDEDAVTVGPYTLRIEQMATNPRKDVWDEKGAAVVALFQGIGIDLPKVLDDDVPLFLVNDRLTDQDNNTFWIVSPPFYRNRTVFLTLELRG